MTSRFLSDSYSNMADAFKSSDLDAEMISRSPKYILLFSGKRKCGKDFITDKLFETLGPGASVIIKISGPIKSHWAKTKNLDINQLLSDGEYKEKYRMEMAKWGEDVRRNDPGYFCRAAIDMYNAKHKDIWIVSDVRRKTDIKWFTSNFPDKCKSIRISCSDETRKERGWTFTPGIDDGETECDLDDMRSWDLTINNEDGDLANIVKQLLHLIGQ